MCPFRILILVFVPILFTAAPPVQAEDGAMTGQPQIKTNAQLTAGQQTALRKSVTDVKTDTDRLGSMLNTMAKVSPVDRENAWRDVHDTIARLKTNSINLREHTSALRAKNLKRTEWASTENDFNEARRKLETIRKSYEILASESKLQAEATTAGTTNEEINARRSELESKFKAGEQARNSDYNILISIIKTMNDELGVFSKAMM